MKVRVIKEMPFAKVGEVRHTDKVNNSIAYNIGGDGGFYGVMCGTEVKRLIQDGWLEEVKEETLEETLRRARSDLPSSESNYSRP